MTELTGAHLAAAYGRGQLLAKRHHEMGLVAPLSPLEEYVSVPDLVFAITGEKMHVTVSVLDANVLFEEFESAYYDAFDEEE